ncbi:MAG: hypothetical protein FWH40_04900 [Coriobacteriia bacterium]|nr:hypothetical protein [Coriobacteriia bacterium]
METTQKHLIRLRKQIDARLGKGSAETVLAGIEGLEDDMSSRTETADWVITLIDRLETSLSPDDFKTIREETACIKANKYSAYNKKYFPQIRDQYPDDDQAYLKAVAQFLDGRGRVGKLVEYQDGKLVCHFGFGDACACSIIKNSLVKPPSTSWCQCCQGSVKSILQFVYLDKKCTMRIVETFASGGKDCVFEASFS